MAENVVIQTVDLRKNYDGVEALRGLNLTVSAGSIHGLLGRNGAGKTTALKVLLGMARPTRGDARVFGFPADSPPASVRIRRRTGFVSEEKDLADFMTVEELVRFTAALYPRWRLDLERRYLDSFKLRREFNVKTLSRGMRTKLAVLLALCRGAELLMLDEPTSGLDPAAAEDVLQSLVRHVAEDGTTVLLSSHQIAELDQIADHVTIVDQGQALLSGELDRLREDFRRVRFVFDGEAPDHVFRAPGVARVRRHSRTLTVWSSAGAERIVGEAQTLRPVSVDVAPLTLKEIFLETVTSHD